jgi:hypothetical protein
VEESRLRASLQSLNQGKLSPPNILRAACLTAVFASVVFAVIRGKNYFGFNYVFAAWLGVTVFCLTWSVLTFGRIFAVPSTRQGALSDAQTWIAIVVLGVGLVLAVRFAIEVWNSA